MSPEQAHRMRLRLGELMEAQRIHLNLRWQDVATRSELSRTTLNDIRRGKIEKIQALSKRAIEQALEWAPGSVDAILAGGDPTPREAVASSRTPDAERSDRHEPSARAELEAGQATPEDIVLTLQVALRRGGPNLFWETYDLLNKLHNPLLVEPAEDESPDRSA